MPFEYSCFISFRHGSQKLAEEIVSQMYDALAYEIELFTTEKKVFVDWERLQGGDFYNETLACALCKSVCMIMIYTPSYFDEYNTFCAREYMAMESIESKRLNFFSQTNYKQHGLIIPVIFRGKKHLPQFISSKRHYYDFEDFLLGSSRIAENPNFNIQIKRLAEYIYDRYKDLSSISEDVCRDCDNFLLPSEEDGIKWIESFKSPVHHFPRV